MKVSKRKLRSIIREERSRLLSEQGGFGPGPDNMAMVLIEFAKAWSSMGGAVQEQVEAIIEATGADVPVGVVGSVRAMGSAKVDGSAGVVGAVGAVGAVGDVVVVVVGDIGAVGVFC